MATKKKTETAEIEILEIKTGRIRCNIIGRTPLIEHRFDKKAIYELLLPSPKGNRAEREQSLKHDPIAEFRGALYMNRNPKEPAAFHFPSGGFGAALAAAALDLPGSSKAQIKRLVSISDIQVNIFGIPKMIMNMVRSSDMARTPDVRSRPIFPEWACSIEIGYVSNLIREGHVVNLLSAAGVFIGIGDWRPQKGGSHGKFEVVGDKDKDFNRIIKTQGRVPQMEAVQKPVAYDADTEELFAWFKNEVKIREKRVPSMDGDGIGLAAS